MLTTILPINEFELTFNFEHVTFKALHSCWYLRTEDDLYIQNWKGPVDMTVDRNFPTLVPMNGKVSPQFSKYILLIYSVSCLICVILLK
jgi:hypothetical protein